MAILHDKDNKGTFVKFTFLRCIPGEYEGCRLNFQYHKANKIIYDLDFGWTNITIKNYIELTSVFPLEIQNGIQLNQLYTSFENHLYGLEWKELGIKNAYQLRFFGSQQNFLINANYDNIRQFGNDLRLEWERGLNLH
ncbi:hypothetical protein OIN60_05320 [Paenibacillus sp. P96]|uniref:Uncharacterized protein n=1 Tax=Paenibacillus zeirhizosphaerae TaxID=2987519 RepID=A0ABT9FN87_9BACL|nr:hypothetical protein [Paenibacillus sp. P96]MDP4096190.1 hypothetical protein [Paenibacillus sp. P96]